jgi:Uma2 family endonuclease
MAIQQKHYTLAEFHAYSELPENKNRLFELVNGEIVEKVASFVPSRIAMRIGRFIGNAADSVGYVTGADGSYILSEEHEFMPDVGYISKSRLPEQPERQVEGAPDLAVEVKSPTDSKRELRMKAEIYLRFGTKIVWLIFPEDKRVEVYVPGEDVREFGLDDSLDGGDVLPGFTLSVQDIFST